MRDTAAIYALTFFIGITSASNGEEIAYVFEGTVLQNLFEPFGLPTKSFTPVTGRFIFNTDAGASHSPGACECLGYRQQLIGGFSADFGDVHIRADDYVVEVTNNFTQSDGSVLDFVTIEFSDNLDPSPAFPLNVDNTPRSMGVFSLSFVADGSQLSSVALPSEINLNDFASDFNFLADSTIFQPSTGNIRFNITSLTHSPVVTGDYNFDGTVNGADLTIWQSSFGSTGNLSADGNRNGVVDAADFTVWRDARDTALIVPETQSMTCWLILTSVVFQTFRRRRTGRRNGHSK